MMVATPGARHTLPAHSTCAQLHSRAGFFVGDYEGLARLREGFLPFFVLANSGNVNNRTDVFAANPQIDDGDVSGNTEEISVAPRDWKERVKSHREGRAGQD